MSTFLVTLDVKQRGDHLYARCAEVPGLNIVGDTREALRTTALKAVKDLYRRNRHMDVDVYPTDDLTQLRIRTAD